MKASKNLMVLTTLSMLALSVACESGKEKYAAGFAEGQALGYTQGLEEGYDDGYADGDAAGFKRGRDFFASPEYLQGYDTGYAQVYPQAYVNGYTAGKTDGLSIGYNNGYNDGYDDGYDDGVDVYYNSGYNAGYSSGYWMGRYDGRDDGYDIGYDDGFDDGYDLGYDDGFYDGSFSVGKSKTLKGYANILSMAHNDMFDYSKIPAPKSTARGIVANGKLLFEETSLTNKDTLKRAAVVEQYLVMEMARQVKGKFGLSNDRSLKVAKAANHFRKFAAKRALTNEDTDAYMMELTGSNLKTMERAVLSGDMQFVLEKAAEKNGTSPEKMAEVLAKHFI